MTLKELLEKRKALMASIDVLLAKEALTDEEMKSVEDGQSEVRKIDLRIDTLRTNEDLKARGKEPASAAVVPEPESRGRITDVKDLEAQKPYSTFGDFLYAVYRAGCPDGETDKRLLEIRAGSGMNESVPSEGGFLVQQDFAAELFAKTHDQATLLPRCRRIPIGPGKNGLKANRIVETSRATGSRWGGVRAYWTDEGALKHDTHPAFGQMDMRLNKLTGLYYATDELLEDVTALGAIATQAFTEEFAWLIDDAILNGTGGGQPKGIMSSGALVSVAAETGQVATTIVAENIIKMWARMWARSWPNAVWLINQDCMPQLSQLSIAAGTAGIPVYMPAGGLSTSPYGTLFSRPVIPIEQCATLGTVGDIVLADLSEYLIIEKGGIQSASSIHVRFVYDETTFRFVYRIDGQPLWNSTLTPANGSNTVSPYVALATRS